MALRAQDLRGYHGWADRAGAVSVCFLGKGPAGEVGDVVRRVVPERCQPAWLRQVHGAVLCTAQPGYCGEGDALLSADAGLALSVVTADCVPVLLASPDRVAAVHAGWRGIVQQVVPRTLARLGRGPVEAWIGPAIGPCCYEVDADVAGRVVGASDPSIRTAGVRGKPHLDLVGAVAAQLREAAVRRVHSSPLCTRCAEDRLWSYRREGPGAGRNVAVIWRDPQ